MKKTILILVAIIILGVGGYFLYSYIRSSKNVQNTGEITEQGFSAQIEDKELSVQYIADPQDKGYGVPIYPNAQASKSKDSSAQVNINETDFTMATFLTSDSVSRVVEYYKKQFGGSAVSNQYTDEDITYNIVTLGDAQSPVVSVFQKDGKTNILIVKK